MGHVSNPRGVERRQADERNEEEDSDRGVTRGERPTLATRATMNVDTSLENRDLCRLVEEMKKSRRI